MSIKLPLARAMTMALAFWDLAYPIICLINQWPARPWRKYYRVRNYFHTYLLHCWTLYFLLWINLTHVRYEVHKHNSNVTLMNLTQKNKSSHLIMDEAILFVPYLSITLLTYLSPLVRYIWFVCSHLYTYRCEVHVIRKMSRLIWN